MVFSVANMTDRPWPIAETSMCYKNRGAVEFWDPDLGRTYVEWNGEPVIVSDRIKQIHGPEAFWPKNQLHRCDFATCVRTLTNLTQSPYALGPFKDS